MAKMIVRFSRKDGFFSEKYRQFVSFYGTAFWQCWINGSGITCKSNAGWRKITFRLDFAGKITVRISADGEPEKLIKKSVPPISEGYLFLPRLSSRDKDVRYPHVRTVQFQEFLDKYGVTAVRRENPNGLRFNEENYRDGTSHAVYTSFYTDGVLSERVNDATFFTPDPGTLSHDNGEFYEERAVSVTGASWLIRRSEESYYGRSASYTCVLYTLKDVMDLEESFLKNGVSNSLY